ncbi:hypothetical protein [Microbacterium stercoris]|uniref:Uncharacterized protein n=1 Tax=Microbacterium stercoris TaxID=2820289 RepID=A0A939TR99_9MICO|nr:hypothetical protein [Microbacterium stercoris]MBO3663931.1 hypothetical protein [Microbacterium stercoris]
MNRRRVTRRRTHAGRTSMRRAVVAALAVAAVVGGGLSVALPAVAAPRTLVVDSLAASGRDAVPGDGNCATDSKTCTLRAAIEESNALKGASGGVEIVVKDGLSGDIKPTMIESTGNWMTTANVTSWDAGAAYEITAPVTIDLGNRVGVYPVTDLEMAAFHVNGEDITLKNFTDIFGSGSSVVFGPNAKRVVLEGGQSVTTRSYYPERFAVYEAGATDITIRNYRLQGFYNDGEETGLFLFDAGSKTAPISNIRIDGVAVDYVSGGLCTFADGTGCRTNLTSFYERRNVNLQGFSFTNSRVTNLSGVDAFRFGLGTAATSITLSDLDISGNTFLNVQGRAGSYDTSLITMPNTPLGGANRISNNTFLRADSGQSYAIGWAAAASPGLTAASGLDIIDNHFDGYSTSSIRLRDTGRVNVSGNTFGARSASQARPALGEETSDNAALLLDNHAATANEGLRTWYPSATATVLTKAAPEGSIVVSPRDRDSISSMCMATVQVTKPTGAGTGILPADGADLEVYWTANSTAELYLGRAENVAGATANLTFSLPMGAQTLPGHKGNVSVVAVDPTTGTVSGYVRVQTHLNTEPQNTSSQYSRVVPVTGNCRPALTLKQTETQNDPTTNRQLHYRLTSSVPLDPSTVQADDIKLTAVATEFTYDATRINARVTGVTPVEGSNGTIFDVLIEVDDSATVTATLPKGTVAATSGLANAGPAASDDSGITFTNPVTATKSKFSVVTGEPNGQEYAYALRAGAPVPNSELVFELALDAAGQEHGVRVSDSAPEVAAEGEHTDLIRVTAREGAVAANTATAILGTLRSGDPRYDGLVVPTVTPFLFATDPSIEIDKRAYTGVTDSSSPARIEATGTPALSGARLLDAEQVCFVYTVTNRSQDDWATTLSEIVVTDSDTRLGQNGTIGTIARLGIGESTSLSACATLIPVDTTVTVGAER